MTVATTSLPSGVGRDHDVFGEHRVAFATVTFDSSYPTGGEAWDPVALLGITDVILVIIEPRPIIGTPNKAYVVQYRKSTTAANRKLLAFEQLDPAAVGGADLALTEVDDTTDLSGLIVDICVIGA